MNVGERTLEVRIAVEREDRDALLRQAPFLVLAFGVVLTLVGTLYVRGNQVQAQRLEAVNVVLERRNQDLNLEIARRERLNREIVRAERDNRALIDSVSDIIFEIDETGEILFLSAAWKRVTGLEANDTTGRNLFDMLHPQDREEQRAALARVVGEKGEGGQGTRSFARLRGADGSFRSVELALSVRRKDRNGAVRIVGTITDVEERRRAERMLAETERKYRTIVENAAGGIYQMAPDGRYLSVNPAMARILGYDSPDQMLREVSDAGVQIYGGSRDYLDFVRETALDVKNRRAEIEARRRDGTRIWVAETMRAVRDENGAVLYFEGGLEDVTARKSAEIALREAKIQSDLASRAKSEFLANMSHELRTPLNAIIGFSEIIKNEVFGPVGQQVYWEYAHEIHEGGRRLLDVINQILDVSRIESGERRLNESIVDVEKVLGESLVLLGSRIAAGGLFLENRIEGRVPRLIAEELALKQILTNLISNAVKFTPAGGRVILDAEVEADGRLRLSVTDTGVGMDEEQVRKALSGFGSVDGSHSRAHTGVGLGLALVGALARLHGASLEIVSRKGTGTTASITFPAKRVAAADPIARKKPEPSAPARGEKALRVVARAGQGDAATEPLPPTASQLPVDPSS